MLENSPQLRRSDLRVSNSWDNLLDSHRPQVLPRKVIKKSELDQALKLHKLEKLNRFSNETFTKINKDAQAFSSQWSVVVDRLEKVKDLVDKHDFISYQEFDTAYEEALVAVDAYKKAIEQAIDDIDDYVINVKAVLINKEDLV